MGGNGDFCGYTNFGLTMIGASGYCLGMRKTNIFLMIMMLRILS